jgi:DNA-binding NarL/FixJ family response regulator
VRGNGEKTAVILDRHPLWLDALERLLDRVGVTVVGTTTSLAEALDLIEETRPTVFITEFDCLEQSAEGVASLRRVAASNPDVHSVVLSTQDDPASIEAAFAAGASVYCVKTAEPEDLASAIRQAFNSSVYYSTTGRSGRGAEPAPSRQSSEDPGLTKREVEILQLVAEGYSNSQLAKMLWVTEQTVKFHLSNIYRKLSVSNRTEASRFAHVNGLVRTSSPRLVAA